MPRGFHRQWPWPRDFGVEDRTFMALLGAMLQTWKHRLRAIFTPEPADTTTAADYRNIRER